MKELAIYFVAIIAASEAFHWIFRLQTTTFWQPFAAGAVLGAFWTVAKWRADVEAGR